MTLAWSVSATEPTPPEMNIKVQAEEKSIEVQAEGGELEATSGQQITAENITPAPFVENPVERLLDGLDKDSYSGAYWDGTDEFHIIPVPGKETALESKISSLTQIFDSVGMPKIVIDTHGTKAVSTIGTTVYSMNERLNAQDALMNKSEELNIQGVGLGIDTLTVYMNEGATEADKQAVLDFSDVKAIEFSD